MARPNRRRKATDKGYFGMSKYIIKNCPSCYYIYCDKEYECNWRGSGITRPCQDRTDCVMKQIVELCEQYKKDFSVTNGVWLLANNITNLLDIQEVE